MQREEGGNVRPRELSQVLRVPAPRQHGQGDRCPVQPDHLRVAAVSDDGRRVRVLLEEPAGRKASSLGHGRLSPLSEASGKGVVRDASEESHHGLLRALVGDL